MYFYNHRKKNCVIFPYFDHFIIVASLKDYDTSPDDKMFILSFSITRMLCIVLETKRLPGNL